MSFTLEDFRRIKLLKESHNSIAAGHDGSWATQVLFVVSDYPVANPHEYYSNLSHTHIACVNFGQRTVLVSYKIKTSHAAIGFVRNQSQDEWEGFERVKPIDPLYPPSGSKYVNNNSSHLVLLPPAALLQNETFEIEFDVKPTEGNIQSNQVFLDALILLDEPIKTGEQLINMNIDYDVFISHASEDKDTIARPLTEMLRTHGVRVWFDEFELKVGDSLRESIDAGLAKSKHGIVILSPNFFSKKWTKEELDGLMALKTALGNKILPVWHNTNYASILEYSAMLAGKVGISTSLGLDTVAREIIRAIQ
jgi:hypothetical protein